MITTVLFDLDGTLVDSAPGVQHAVSEAWRAVQPAGSACPEVRPLMGPPIREMFRRALPCAETATLDALEHRFRAAYDTEGWRRTAPFPGVTDTLNALKQAGARCLGVTNKPAVPTARILDHCGLAGFFEVFLSPDSRTPPFPSKADAAERLIVERHIDRARAALVGDTVEDARVATACGLRFLGFRGGYGWTELQGLLPAAAVFQRFEDLPLLLRTPAELY